VGRWQLWQGRTCKPHVILTNLIASALGGTGVETDQPHMLKVVLAAAYGIRNAVRKTRECHMHGRTRIHIDDVESLGNFLELEVILEETEDERVGEIEIYELMKKLGLNEIQLIEGAYVDLLEQGAQ